MSKDKLNKLKVEDLKNIIRSYNLHTKIKMSKRKKEDLINDLDKHIFFEGETIKLKQIVIKEIIKAVNENKNLSYAELKFKFRNHPAIKLNNEINDIKKRLDRNDYENKKDKKEAEKQLEKLINIQDSDDMYKLNKNGLPIK